MPHRRLIAVAAWWWRPCIVGENGRAAAVAEAGRQYDAGEFLALLARRVARHTESPVAASAGEMRPYLTEEMAPYLAGLGFDSRIVGHGERGHFLLGSRHEGDGLPTVLIYGHGDVVPGMAGAWAEGRDPWAITPDGERLYGRGMADNKGQHSVNLAALGCVLKVRGRLGFNVKLLLEMGEELGSPGLRAVCREERAALAADVLIASDGPRLSPERRRCFSARAGRCGCAGGPSAGGGASFGQLGRADQQRGHRADPCVGEPDGCTRAADGGGAAAGGVAGGGAGGAGGCGGFGRAGAPAVEPDWGEPGLSPAERVFGWNTLEILAFSAGNIRQPAAAIPGTAEAVVMLRFVVGLDWHDVEPILQRHLDAHGFGAVRVTVADGGNATRTSSADPWVGRVLESVRRTTGKKPALLPNFGGTLPNDVFVEELGLPTIWLPHSYPGCNQHAPDEHNLAGVLREGLEMMAGLFWDIGAG